MAIGYVHVPLLLPSCPVPSLFLLKCIFLQTFFGISYNQPAVLLLFYFLCLFFISLQFYSLTFCLQCGLHLGLLKKFSKINSINKLVYDQLFRLLAKCLTQLLRFHVLPCNTYRIICKSKIKDSLVCFDNSMFADDMAIR